MTRDPSLYRRVGGWHRALVVFSGRADLWYLRLLKPGFRHCFVALSDGEQWVTVEPLSHCTEVVAIPIHGDFDIAAYYRAQGMTVVETQIRDVPKRGLWWAPSTCVEGVKRILGLRNPLILTPWTLSQALIKEKNHQKVKKCVDICEQKAYKCN